MESLGVFPIDQEGPMSFRGTIDAGNQPHYGIFMAKDIYPMGFVLMVTIRYPSSIP